MCVVPYFRIPAYSSVFMSPKVVYSVVLAKTNATVRNDPVIAEQEFQILAVVPTQQFVYAIVLSLHVMFSPRHVGS